MIRVNELSTVNFISRPTFKSEEAPNEVISKEQEVSNLKGIDALASYNLSVLKTPEKLDDIQPIELIFNPEDEIEGEKIYTSDGKLHAIIKEDENTKKIYIPNEENADLVATVQIVDKNTGKVIKEQHNDIEDGEYEGSAWIGEYSPVDEKLVRSTGYDKNKNVEFATRFEHPKEGQTVSISNDVADKEYSVNYYNDKYDLYVVLDKNKQPVYYRESKDVNSIKHVDNYAHFYNGSLYYVQKNESTIVPNALGREKLDNPELRPTPKYVSQIDLKGQEGEKSYYSNGAIEKNVINNGEINAFFDLYGNLEKVKTGNKEILFDIEGSQTIIEDLGEDKTKTTEYYNSGCGDVCVRTKDSFSEIFFDENKRPRSYYEGTIDENGDKDYIHSLEFNENGMLTSSD